MKISRKLCTELLLIGEDDRAFDDMIQQIAS